MFAMSPARCSFCTAAALMVLAVPSAATGAQAKSPRALYKALLTSAIPTSQLPAGFHSSTTKAFRVGAEQKRHNAVGEVSIDFDNGRNASIVYVIFPTRTDAVGNLARRSETPQDPARHDDRARPSTAYPSPPIVVRFSVQGLSITSITAVAGNVGINAISLRGLAEATRVAHVAVKHLNAVR